MSSPGAVRESAAPPEMTAGPATVPVTRMPPESMVLKPWRASVPPADWLKRTLPEVALLAALTVREVEHAALEDQMRGGGDVVPADVGGEFGGCGGEGECAGGEDSVAVVMLARADEEFGVALFEQGDVAGGAGDVAQESAG